MEHRFKLAPENAGARLDQALCWLLPEFSRSRVKKVIEAGGVRVNGGIVLDADARMAGNEEICFSAPENRPALTPEEGALKIVWRDNAIAVCDKEPGLVTHPCPSCPGNTLVNRLLAAFPQLVEQGGERPGIVHRLDKDTSGLLLVALTEGARLKLAANFADRKIVKEYLALVAGRPPDSGECHEPIGRHPTQKTKMAIVAESHGGRPAHTRWRRLWTASDGSISLVAARIFTGRTHQIRVHLANAGYPILGDSVYAPGPVKSMAPRQMLHAWRLEFEHPATGEHLRFHTPPPEDFYMAAISHSTPPRPIVITGSQGCGKSTFCRNLQKLGVAVASADEIVARLYGAGGHVSGWLEQRFGRELLKADGAVDKPALFAMFQRDASMRAEFEKMAHALVKDEIENFWRKSWQGGQALAAAEVPLYFESGWDASIAPKPFVIGVHCPENERWQRIAETRGWSREKMETIEKWQWPEERKMARCDFVVNNSGKEADLAAQAQKALAAFMERQNMERGAAGKKLASLWNVKDGGL